MTRTATRRRETGETSVEVSVNLDGSGNNEIATGIPFFDHMLDQVGRHGGLDLTIRAEGDLVPSVFQGQETIGRSILAGLMRCTARTAFGARPGGSAGAVWLFTAGGDASR
ncbi:MAG: hypothetical protein ACPGSH_02250 [Ilumatobacteraceae bacterium]